MAHAPRPLKIGCAKRTGTGYAKPHVFWREKSEVVEVSVETDCYVKLNDLSRSRSFSKMEAPFLF